MKMIPTNVTGEVIYAGDVGGTYFVETPLEGATLSRDNVEQLIAELESLLREGN